MVAPRVPEFPADEAETQRLVVESLAEGVVVTDALAQIISCNESALRILGLSRDEMLGRRTIDPEWRTIHEDGSPFPPEEYPAYLVIHDGLPRLGAIMGVYKPGGDIAWVSINATPLPRPGGGAPVGAVASFIDVTELRRTAESLRESEELHRSLVASLAEGLVVLSREGNITSCNDAAATLFGVDAQAVIGPLSRVNFAAVREDGSPFPTDEFPAARVFATGRPASGVVMGIDLAGTPRRWIQVHAQPFGISRDDGRPLSVVISFADLTERLAGEAEARKLEAQLLDAQKMEAIGTLAGGLAHDFNNVLFAIQGNVEMARMELTPGHPARSSVAEALHSCERAKALVQRILAFSRRQETTRRPLAIAPIVAETTRLLRSALPAGVTIVQSIDGDLPLVVADDVEVQQIVLNLCTNAGHALKDIGGEIALRLESVTLDESAARELGLGPGEHVRLAVTDHGVGIDGAAMPHVFDPFFTTKPVGEGTGIGLAVVRQIVDSSDGAIALRSERGRGTTVEIYLPITLAREEVSDGAAAPIRANGERVLFADDDPTLVRMAERLLSRMGFKVRAVGSASAALEALRTSGGAFDIVLTDVTMPRMSGLELAGAIQREWPRLPVLLTTGNAAPIDADEMRQLGVRELIHKPWTSRQLIEALFRHL